MSHTPKPNPDLFKGNVDGQEIAESSWAAALTQRGEFVIVVMDTITGGDGGPVGIVAQCPAFEIADYIAHLHNMILADPKAFKTIVDHVANEHDHSNPVPIEDIFKPRPEETGGYL